MLAVAVRSSLQENGQQGAQMKKWISTKEAAELLDVSVTTVLRSFASEAKANEKWGEGNWRRKPLSDRRDMQVLRARAEQLAAEAVGFLGDGPPPTDQEDD